MNNSLMCIYCGNKSAQISMPPLCVQHFDLVILINYLKRTGRAVTVETIIDLLATGIPLSITVDDVRGLLASYEQVELSRPFARL